MISKNTQATAIKALERLAKRTKSHIEHNQEQYKVYEEQLRTKGAITTLSAGFRVKEEFHEDNAFRLLKLHNAELEKHRPILAEYESAIAELKGL